MAEIRRGEGRDPAIPKVFKGPLWAQALDWESVKEELGTSEAMPQNLLCQARFISDDLFKLVVELFGKDTYAYIRIVQGLLAKVKKHVNTGERQIAQVVEQVLGKDEVTKSIFPTDDSINPWCNQKNLASISSAETATEAILTRLRREACDKLF